MLTIVCTQLPLICYAVFSPLTELRATSSAVLSRARYVFSFLPFHSPLNNHLTAALNNTRFFASKRFFVICVCVCVCVCNGVLKNSLPCERDVRIPVCPVPRRFRRQHCVMEGSPASPLVLVSLELRWTELSSIGRMILKRKYWHARRKPFSVPL